LTGKIGHDWDIELTHKTLSFSKDHWKQLGKELGRDGRISFLAYDVIRLEIKNYQIEISPPRKETFESELSDRGHKNFSVEFDFQMPFEKAVQRRDFTFNAMGLRLEQGQWSFLDPLNGRLSLHDKILNNCGEDFFRDPVRFLRAWRFALRFNMEFGPDLKEQLSSMNLHSISHTYFWNEMLKSKNPVGFLVCLIQEKKNHPELELPVSEDFLLKQKDLKLILLNPESPECWIMALEWVGLDALKWQDYFSRSSESARKLTVWARSTKTFAIKLPESFHGDFDTVRVREEFLDLFNWFYSTKQVLQKNPTLPLLEMIEKYLPNWIHLYRFEMIKDVKHIEPSLRAKYQVWSLVQRL